MRCGGEKSHSKLMRRVWRDRAVNCLLEMQECWKNSEFVHQVLREVIKARSLDVTSHNPQVPQRFYPVI